MLIFKRYILTGIICYLLCVTVLLIIQFHKLEIKWFKTWTLAKCLPFPERTFIDYTNPDGTIVKLSASHFLNNSKNQKYAKQIVSRIKPLFIWSLMIFVLIPVFLVLKFLLSRTIKARIKKCFEKHGIKIKLKRPQLGPRVIRYRLILKSTVKAATLKSYESDLQIALKLKKKPVLSTGKFIFLDIQRSDPQIAYWKDFFRPLHGLIFPVAISLRTGRLIHADMSKPSTCHFMVSGMTGSGKSEFLKQIFLSLVSQNTPKQLQFTVIDPKVLTFGFLTKDNPYLTNPIITDTEEAISVLNKLCDEMDKRYFKLNDEGYENITQRIKDKKHKSRMPFQIILIDEFSDLIRGDKKIKAAFEEAISRIASKGRAAGYHLILSTQYAKAEIINTTIKANCPARVCLKVKNQTNSDVALGTVGAGAEKLLGSGDMIFDLGLGVERGQSLFVDRDELIKKMNVLTGIEEHGKMLEAGFDPGYLLFDPGYLLEVTFANLNKIEGLENRIDYGVYGDQLRIKMKSFYEKWVGFAKSEGLYLLSRSELEGYLSDFLLSTPAKQKIAKVTCHCMTLSIEKLKQNGIKVTPGMVVTNIK